MPNPIDQRRFLPKVLFTVSTVLGFAALSLDLPAQAPAAVASVFTNAMAERDLLPAAEGSLWRFEGPRNLGRGIIGGYGLSPHSGRINEVAVFPGNPDIMYATGATGGVWKTTDGGQQWASRSSGWATQASTAVAVDPSNPNRVFVGTGDYKRVDHIPPFSVGVMRSLDGGMTWERSGTAEMGEYTVSRVVIDPDAGTVLAATGRGSRLPGGKVWRSPDGGATWVDVGVPDANWDDLESCGGGTLWAAATRRKNLDNASAANLTALVYQSVNGIDWTPVSISTAGGFNSTTVIADTIQIACDPASASVFVGVYFNSIVRVFSTTNAGANWTEMTAVPLAEGGFPWAHAAMGVTTNFLFVGGVAVFRGSLGPAGALTFTPLPGPSLHSDFQCAVPHPTQVDVVFLCNDGGLYRHSAPSNTTTSLSATLGVTQIYRMDVHPRHGGLIGIGTQDLGNSVSFFGNGNDPDALRQPPNWALVLGGDGRSSAFAQDDTSNVYQAITNGAVVRYDGSTRTVLLDAPNSQSPLAYRADTLYYANTSFWRLLSPATKDNGLGTADWIESPFRPAGPAPAMMQSIAVCPTNASVIYAASTIAQLFSSDDGGLTWDELEVTGLPANIPIWAISPSPTNCRDVLLGIGYEGESLRNGSNTFHAGDRLFRKADVTAVGAWTGAHGGPQALPHAPVFAIVRHPSAPGSTWFVSGDVGVFRTDDGGGHWANATGPLGLPNTLVRDLRISEDGNRLYAATFGRGVWRMDVARPAADMFGVRGTVTIGGRPLANVSVVVQGAGRVRKWLDNTITTGTTATTAGIDVAESAFIAQARATLRVASASAVSLVTPGGSELPMTTPRVGLSGPQTFILERASASALTGQLSRGVWRFRVTGSSNLSPTVSFGSVEFDFTDRVSVATSADGEYTIEYLRAGSHVVSIFDCDCAPITLGLTVHRTDIDFGLNPPVSIVADLPRASEPTTSGQFTVTRAGSYLAGALTVNYAIAGSATNTTDYGRLTGSVTIPAGSASATINVTPVDDRLDEATETVALQLTSGAGYEVVVPSEAVVTIADDDPLPRLSINSVTVSEGGTATFSATLTPVSGRNVSANFRTADGTARVLGLVCGFGSDYLPRSGTVSFAPGTTTRTISVPTCADSVVEGNHNFFVDLFGSGNAVFGNTRGTATIVEGAGRTGTFQLTPTDGLAAVNEPVVYAFSWEVPPPLNWHDLNTLDIRFRRGSGVVLWVRFDEASNTFALVTDSGDLGPSVTAGRPQRLQTAGATLHLGETSVVGSGPTGPGVTLNLAVSIKPLAAGLVTLVEVAATDDLGNQDEFALAGTITVTPQR